MTDTTDDYGYLLVHFIEDPDGYAEKIYMDISDVSSCAPLPVCG